MSAITTAAYTEDCRTLAAVWKANWNVGAWVTACFVVSIVYTVASSDLPISLAGTILALSLAMLSFGYTVGAWIIMHIYRAAAMR